MPLKVVIVGGGFAGLTAAGALRGAPLDVTLIARDNYHLFQPLLYQVAAGELDGSAIATPIRSLLRGRDVRFHWGSVQEIDWQARRLVCADGFESHWDRLILAAGAVTNFFGNENLAGRAFDLKGLGAAETARSGILGAIEHASASTDPEEIARSLTFVIAGGGATGVEFCGALLELLRILLGRDYPELRGHSAQVRLIQGGARVLPEFASGLGAYAQERLTTLGAIVTCNTHVADFDGERVTLSSGETIAARTVIWSAGVTAHPLAARLPGPKAHGGRVPVDAHLRALACPEVYVLGDLAYGEDAGAPWPQTAIFAMQSARHAARHLRAEVEGEAGPPSFRYRDEGRVAVLHRFDAVAEWPRRHWRARGLTAWIAWLIVHLYRIIGTRNRVLTLLDWATVYLRHDAAVNLIRETRKSGPRSTAPR